MKIEKLLLMALLGLFVSTLAAQKKTVGAKGYAIEVKLKSQVPDSMLYLVCYYGEKKIKVDSALAIANPHKHFIFKGDSILPSGIYLVVNQRRMQLFELIVDRSQCLSVELDTLAPIKSIVVKNSPESELFYQYLKGLTLLQDSVREVEKVLDYANQSQNKELFTSKYAEYLAKIQRVEQYTNQFVEKNPGELFAKALRMNHDIDIPELPVLPDGTKDSIWGWNYYKKHYWDHVDLDDSRLFRTPVFGTKITDFFDKLISQHPDSIIREIDTVLAKTRPSPEMFRLMLTWFTDRYQKSPVLGHDAIFVHLVETYFMNHETPWMSENMMRIYTQKAVQLKPLLIGAKIPELVMADTTGINLLSSYHAGAKYTILWFWDPTCPHCVVETPKLVDFYHRYRDSIGVQVFAVSLDRDLERWKKYIREHRLDWINVGGEQANIDYVMAFDLMSTPAIFVMDNQQRIIVKNIPVENLKEFFQRYERIYKMK